MRIYWFPFTLLERIALLCVATFLGVIIFLGVNNQTAPSESPQQQALTAYIKTASSIYQLQEQTDRALKATNDLAEKLKAQQEEIVLLKEKVVLLEHPEWQQKDFSILTKEHQ